MLIELKLPPQVRSLALWRRCALPWKARRGTRTISHSLGEEIRRSTSSPGSCLYRIVPPTRTILCLYVLVAWENCEGRRSSRRCRFNFNNHSHLILAEPTKSRGAQDQAVISLAEGEGLFISVRTERSSTTRCFGTLYSLTSSWIYSTPPGRNSTIPRPWPSPSRLR